MKQCTKCGSFKDKIEFSKQSKYVDGQSYWCRVCWKQYRKEYRFSNLEKQRIYNNDQRAKRIQWFQKCKSTIPCADCGQIYEPYCMDYDHIPENGKKIKSISRMVMDNTPKEVIFDEIDKCELVCLMCHNRRTHDRFNEKLGHDRKYRKSQRRNIEIINNFKSRPCVICGIEYELFNMQLDHVDPSTKLYDVCRLKNRKLEILLAELNKCQVMCAMCHRRKSIIEQKDNRYRITS